MGWEMEDTGWIEMVVLSVKSELAGEMARALRARRLRTNVVTFMVASLLGKLAVMVGVIVTWFGTCVVVEVQPRLCLVSKA